MVNDPTVLDLRTVVVADSTIDSNSVACDGLHFHILVLYSAVSIVGTIDVQGVALGIHDVHIAVLGLIDFLNDTGNLVLQLGVSVVCHRRANSKSFFDGDFSTVFTFGFGRSNTFPRGGVGLVAISDGGSQGVGNILFASGDFNGNSTVAVVFNGNSLGVNSPNNRHVGIVEGVLILAGEIFGGVGNFFGSEVISLQLCKCLLSGAFLFHFAQNAEACYEVFNVHLAGVFAGHIGQGGCAKGVVLAICTPDEVLAVEITGE